jgi:hypothetical protein
MGKQPSFVDETLMESHEGPYIYTKPSYLVVKVEGTSKRHEKWSLLNSACGIHYLSISIQLVVGSYQLGIKAWLPTKIASRNWNLK